MPMTIPYVLESSKHGERTYDLFSRMLRDRIVFVNGEINDDVSHIVTSQLLYLDFSSPGAPIQLFINSPGGSVDAGRAIVDVIDYIESPVMKIGMGMCASMGQYILTHKTDKKGSGRYVMPHCRILMHQPMSGVRGQCTDIVISNKQVQIMKTQLIDKFTEWTGQSREAIAKDIERDYWMYPQEALERGFIDGIMDKKQESEKSFRTMDLSGVREWK